MSELLPRTHDVPPRSWPPAGTVATTRTKVPAPDVSKETSVATSSTELRGVVGEDQSSAETDGGAHNEGVDGQLAAGAAEGTLTGSSRC
ncbi:MAG: hypothetical protein ACRDY0_09970 [Acidimicrobiales bacterium]